MGSPPQPETFGNNAPVPARILLILTSGVCVTGERGAQMCFLCHDDAGPQDRRKGNWVLKQIYPKEPAWTPLVSLGFLH